MDCRHIANSFAGSIWWHQSPGGKALKSALLDKYSERMGIKLSKGWKNLLKRGGFLKAIRYLEFDRVRPVLCIASIRAKEGRGG